MDSTCFSVHSNDSTAQAKAVLQCKTHGRYATLAMLDNPELLASLAYNYSEISRFIAYNILTPQFLLYKSVGGK